MAKTKAAPAGDALELRLVPLPELRRWSRNPKPHDLDALAASFRRHGFKDPLKFEPELNGGSGGIVEGNGRDEALEAMRGRGEDPPRGIVVDDAGEWLVPVLFGVDATSQDEAEAYGLDHNATTVVGSDFGKAWLTRLYDADPLRGILADLRERSALPVTVGESIAARLLDPPPDHRLDRPGQTEKAQATQEKWKVEPGQLFTAGPHRVLCGDCMVPEQLALLLDGAEVAAIVTDPPYAIYGSSTGVAADITDDKMVGPFFVAAFQAMRSAVRQFGHVYVFCDWRSWSSLWIAAKRAGLSTKNLLVWDKGGAGLGANYANTWEGIGFFSRLPPQRAMGDRKGGQRTVYKSNVLRYNRPTGDDRQHNAAKPVPLLAELIENSTDEGEAVADLFLGSGSTLVAAHAVGRVGYGCDVDPAWVAVTLERLEGLGLEVCRVE